MQEQEQEQELQSQIFQNENGDLSGVSIIRPGLSDIEPELKKAWISLSTSSSNLGFNEVAYWAAHRLFIDDNDFNVKRFYQIVNTNSKLLYYKKFDEYIKFITEGNNEYNIRIDMIANEKIIDYVKTGKSKGVVIWT